jgi:hypothetical protein
LRRPRHQPIAQAGRDQVPDCGLPLAETQELDLGADHISSVHDSGVLENLADVVDLDAGAVGLAADGLGQLRLELGLGIALGEVGGGLADVACDHLGADLQQHGGGGAGAGALLGVEPGRADRLERAGSLVVPATQRQRDGVLELGVLEGLRGDGGGLRKSGERAKDCGNDKATRPRCTNGFTDPVRRLTFHLRHGTSS